MLEVQQRGAVRVLTLARPKVNALGAGLVTDLAGALKAAHADEATRALVLASGVAGIFSAGFDLKELHAFERGELRAFLRAFCDLYRDLFTGPKPAIAAVGGHAIAGGAVLALACDWRVLTRDKAGFGLTEVDLGLPLPPGVVFLARSAAGERHAYAACVTGVVLEPAEATAQGFVDEQVAGAAVLPRALEWAERLADKPPGALGEIREQFREPARRTLTALDRKTPERFADWWFSADAVARREALLDRLEGRREPAP